MGLLDGLTKKATKELEKQMKQKDSKHKSSKHKGKEHETSKEIEKMAKKELKKRFKI